VFILPLYYVLIYHVTIFFLAFLCIPYYKLIYHVLAHKRHDKVCQKYKKYMYTCERNHSCETNTVMYPYCTPHQWTELPKGFDTQSYSFENIYGLHLQSIQYMHSSWELAASVARVDNVETCSLTKSGGSEDVRSRPSLCGSKHASSASRS